MKEHEIDIRRGVQLPTAIPPQGQQSTGGIGLKCLATDPCAPAIELADHDVRQVCQPLYHLHTMGPLPVLLPDGPPLRLHKVPEKPEELLSLSGPVAFRAEDFWQVGAVKKPFQGEGKPFPPFTGEQRDP
jgi:hypothetical protein